MQAASRAGRVSRRRVATVESRAPAQLSEAQPDDLIGLDDPEQAVTSSIARRPERAEASILSTYHLPCVARPSAST